MQTLPLIWILQIKQENKKRIKAWLIVKDEPGFLSHRKLRSYEIKMLREDAHSRE